MNNQSPRTTDSETSDRPILESFSKETQHFPEQPTAIKRATDRSRKYFKPQLW